MSLYIFISLGLGKCSTKYLRNALTLLSSDFFPSFGHQH